MVLAGLSPVTSAIVENEIDGSGRKNIRTWTQLITSFDNKKGYYQLAIPK